MVSLLASAATFATAQSTAPTDDSEPPALFTIDIEGRQTSDTPPTLLDAWLTVEQEAPVNWSRAFVVRDELAPEERQLQRRLTAELENLSLQFRLLDHPQIAEGLVAWQSALSKLDAGRVPGRVDPTWLMAHLREVPLASQIDEMGWCQTPDWVEAWTPLGVTREPWQPAMTVDDLLAELPGTAYANADQARVITPQGDVRDIGIAAWNHQPASLTPGSRIVVDLPLDAVSARWVDSALPQFLATRVPGDECTTVDTATLYP
ncbi:hypothetical protein GCM10009038_04560 [Salinicola rhizosphaerae]|uniref:Capsule biosynthesis GfcC-like C-terminal domain-containing protein n=2 Tax=Salinicola rhizosphaerae TaxID=1443141 RepID=A0ABQ3DQ72_9GAMM|nr:hypothetical protein GCM10009038_04560 [Salinicola rhizosphaerae]